MHDAYAICDEFTIFCWRVDLGWVLEGIPSMEWREGGYPYTAYAENHRRK